MARTVDSRVVEMKFDNKQFESGVKQSMSTLERLKAALNFKDAGKGLDAFNKYKGTSLDGIAAGIEKLNSRFSALGIAGMRVIQNITDGLMNKVARAVSFVDDAIVSGGVRRAMNIENAHFQLQSILQDEKEVQSVMDSANKSVDGTAYSFDVAAKAASMFTASGIRDTASLDNALRGLAGTTATFNADYESMAMIFTQVAGQGRLMGDQLLQLSTRGANAAVTIANFVNGVNDGSIEVSDSVRAAVSNISTATDVTEADIRDLVSEGKVNFDAFAGAMNWAFGDSAQKANETFTGAFANIKAALARIGAGFVSPLIEQNSAIVKLFNEVRLKVNDVKKALVFDEEIGNINALSKQFTDSILKISTNLSEVVKNADMTKPMQTFYYGVEAIKNVFKGLYSIIKPTGSAFKEVFLSFNGDDVVRVAASITELTSKFKISEEASKNLNDAAKGLFSVFKSGATILVRLLGAIIPINNPLSNMGSGILGVTGNLGRMLEAFSKWLDTSPLVDKSFEAIGTASSAVTKFIGFLIDKIIELVRTAKDLPITQKIFSSIGEAVTKLASGGSKLLTSFIDIVKDLISSFDKLGDSKPAKSLDSINESVTELNKSINAGDGFKTFINNIKEFMSELHKAFSIDNISDKIETLMSTMGKFIDFMKGNVLPSFSDFSIGGAVAAGGGIGIIYALVKASKSLEGISKSIKSIPDVFGALKNTLVAYQNELKANTILKLAGAVALLGAALTVMSFADPKRLAVAASGLTALAAVLLTGFTDLFDAINQGEKVINPLETLAKGVSKALSKLGTALIIKSLGTTAKNFGKSIMMIAGSIIALAVMYRKDPGAFSVAVDLIKDIAIVLGATLGLGTILSQFLGKGIKNFTEGSKAIRNIGLAIGLITLSLIKLMEMELPGLAECIAKFAIFGGILMGAAGLIVSLGMANRIAGKNANISSGPIIASSVLVYGIVMALEKLFKIQIGNDWISKLTMFEAVLISTAGLLVALGYAGRLAEGKVQMAGTLLALSVVIISIAKSLEILSKIKAPSLLKAVIAMEGVFVGLAGLIVSIGAASKLAGGIIKAAGTLVSLALLITVITGSLAVLSIFPGEKLLKGAIALGVVLLAVGGALKGASKISDENTWKNVVAMCLAVGTITAALGVLSLVPFEGLVKAAGALSAVLLALASGLYAAGKIDTKDSIVAIGAMIVALISISASLYILSAQPWDSLLAAGAAISMVLLAFAGVMTICNEIGPTAKNAMKGIEVLLIATLSLIPIGIALYELSGQRWEGLLAAATAIDMVLGGLSGVMAVCAAVGPKASMAIRGIGVLDVLIADLALVLTALGAFWEIDGLQQLMSGGAEMLKLIGQAIGDCVGAIVGGVMEGISNALPGIGKNISQFMINLMPFITLSKIVDGEVVSSTGRLAAALLIMTGAELVAALGSIMGLSLSSFAVELSLFMVALNPFLIGVASITPEMVEATINLAKMILALTVADVITGITNFLGLSGNLESFGEELSKFGPSLKKFADSIDGINEGSVAAAASAAKIMAELASNLPASDTLVEKIFGGGDSLTTFGQELVKFGPLIKKFSDQVKDLDPATISGVTIITSVMSNLASNLPASDTLVEKIFGGGNSLTTFGQELVQFGPLISKFSDQVKGLDPSTITGVVVITTVMTNLANNLPSTPTLVEKILGGGTYSLSSFGRELVTFGPLISQFATSISSVKGNLVSNVATITTTMTNLANNLPSTSTLGEKIFGGGSYTLSGFGQELVKFGKFIGQFADAVSNMPLTSLAPSVEAFKSLTDLANYMGNVSSNSIVDFAKKLSEVPNDAIDGFVKGFEKGESKAKGGIESFFKNVNSILDSQGKKSGEEMGKVAGYIIDGLNSGLQKRLKDLRTTAAEIGQTIDSAVNKSLEIRSPSRKAMKSMGYYVDGAVKGLDDGHGKLQKASKKLGETVNTSVTEGMNLEAVYEVYGQALQPIVKQTEEAAEQIEVIQETQETNSKSHVEETRKISKAKQQVQTEEIVAEQDFWTKLLQIKKTGMDAEKYQQTTMKEFQEQIFNEAKEIYDNYVDQYNSTVESMISSFDLFTEVEQKEAKSKDELVDILDQQINAYEDYAEVMASLNERLDGTALIESLRELGVDSVGQLQVMNSMSDEELQNYSDLYDTKLGAAKNAANQQLVGLQQQTEEDLNKLFGSMYNSVNLFDFGQVFNGSIESLNAYLNEIFIPLETAAATAEQDAINISNAIVNGISGGFSAQDAQAILGHPLSALLDTTLQEQLTSIADPSKNIGTNITSGIAEGMTTDTSTIDSSSMQVMQEILTCLQSAGEIASPSGLMKREVGAFLTDGIAEGMIENTEGLSTASDTIMQNIVSAFTESAPQQMNDAGNAISTALGTGIEAGASTITTAVSNVSTAITTGFTNALPQSSFNTNGQNVVQWIVNGMTAKQSTLLSTIKNICQQIQNQFKTSLPQSTFTTIGNNIIQSIINGMNNKRSILLSSIFNICQNIIDKFRTSLPENTFKTFGENIIQWIINGMTSKQSEVISAAQTMCQTIITEFTNGLSSDKFETIGQNAAIGLGNGIRSKINEIARAAIAAAKAAVEAAKNELDEESPSKKFHKMGEFASIGLANGIIARIKDIVRASTASAHESIEVMKDSVDSINEVINSADYNFNPMIKPEMDLSNVQNGLRSIDSMMNEIYDISPIYDKVAETAATFNRPTRRNNRDEDDAQNGTTNKFEFIQNNYSPKALSRSEIYRQTNNQFSAFRKAVNPS